MGKIEIYYKDRLEEDCSDGATPVATDCQGPYPQETFWPVRYDIDSIKWNVTLSISQRWNPSFLLKYGFWLGWWPNRNEQLAWSFHGNEYGGHQGCHRSGELKVYGEHKGCHRLGELKKYGGHKGCHRSGELKEVGGRKGCRSGEFKEVGGHIDVMDVKEYGGNKGCHRWG